jgi:GTP diphosphokinase / guanosine-3',5'-bis(diphosphate) 3'-diphosphatase
MSIDIILDQFDSTDPAQTDVIRRAYHYAEKAHIKQERFSGEPYFVHLIHTATILAEYGMDSNTIAAGLLHDVLEDANIDTSELQKEFGAEIVFLVEGVTKLGKLRYRGSDRHNESLRKLFVAMSEDIRVLMIKLADRLHNMRTLSHIPKEKQKRIATETLEIYAPIAYRLGIRKLSRELEDLAFPFVYPDEYSALKKKLRGKYEENVESVEKFLRSVQKALAKEGLVPVRTEYRAKGLWSLYKKMQSKKKHIEEIYDILALRIIVHSIDDCYRVLGIVHGSWRPLPGKIKDYIAFPKPNGYQGLHTTVFTGDGNLVEVQIRTTAMHENSEYGIASHISYKAGITKGKKPESAIWLERLLPKKGGFEKRIQSNKGKDVPGWIRDLVAHHSFEHDNDKFRRDIASDFFEKRIFVFTPHGDVVDLPVSSTAIDFAYTIHSNIGDHMSGAKVNGKLISLDTELHNGDIVEIIAKKSSKPTRKWLDYAKTTIAKRHIRSIIQKQRNA